MIDPRAPVPSVLEPLACAIMGLEYPKHWNEWEHLLSAHKRLIVLSSRDHGKTTFFSTIYPLFRAGYKPGFKILIISYSEQQVIKIISGIREAIEASPLLLPLKPDHEGPAWSKTELEYSNGSKIIGRSFGSSVRGLHCDLVIIDDPVKDQGGMGDEEQERFFRNAVIPTVNPDGQLVIVGTRVYDGDLIDRLETNKAFTFKVYPAQHPDTGAALWPERWPESKLRQRKLEIGDFAYAREYLLQKVDPGTQFFKREMIHYWDTLPERLEITVSVDPAITTSGDYTAIVCTGTDIDNKTHVLETVRLHTDSVQKIVDELMRVMMTWRATSAIVETIGFQRMLKHWIFEAMRKANYYFGIKEIRNYNKSKEARIMALQPRIASGSLLFNKAQPGIVDEMLIFPRGAHDDMIDALAMQLSAWNIPAKETSKVPAHSYEWWASKLEEQGAGRMNDTMFRDLTGGSPSESSIVLLS